MRTVAETISRFEAKKIQIPAPVRVFTPAALPCSQSTEAILLMIVVLHAMITMPAFERLTRGRIHMMEYSRLNITLGLREPGKLCIMEAVNLASIVVTCTSPRRVRSLTNVYAVRVDSLDVLEELEVLLGLCSGNRGRCCDRCRADGRRPRGSSLRRWGGPGRGCCWLGVDSAL